MTKTTIETTSMERALIEGSVELCARVSLKEFAESYSELGELMETSPDYAFRYFHDEDSEGETVEDARIDLALFYHCFKRLPIGPYEIVRWIAAVDDKLSHGENVDDFVTSYCASDKNSNRLFGSATVEQIDLIIANAKAARERVATYARDRKRCGTSKAKSKR